eukprot:scaffold866_cov544-Prasinococcus_capsulatus_cf.AAC.6
MVHERSGLPAQLFDPWSVLRPVCCGVRGRLATYAFQATKERGQCKAEPAKGGLQPSHPGARHAQQCSARD